jgi:hypothetical protein
MHYLPCITLQIPPEKADFAGNAQFAKKLLDAE